jgi:DNA-binding HxlR family transcriptional regulator
MLFHRRWAVPVLAELERAHGAKFVTLVQRLGASPTAVRQTLDHLIEAGWVGRNPGYGHPLRPEYILTPVGARRGPICAALDQQLITLDARAIGLKKWSMPILYTIGDRVCRFGEILTHLSACTDRAAALSLRDLAGAALVARNLREYAGPIPVYTATPRGRRLLPLLAAL